MATAQGQAQLTVKVKVLTGTKILTWNGKHLNLKIFPSSYLNCIVLKKVVLSIKCEMPVMLPLQQNAVRSEKWAIRWMTQ